VNFDFSDDQQAIKRTAKDFLAARFTPERVRELAEARRYDEAAWSEMSDLGWPGIFIEERHGGQQLGIVELVILMEELGYVLAPVPFLSNVAAGLALQLAGTDEQRRRWLPGIASGEARGTVGLVQSDGGHPPDEPEARLVPDADTAEVIVLLHPDGGTLVEASAAEIEPLETIDSTRRFARVRSEGGEPLAGDAAGALDRIAVALAAELTGVAQRAMEMAVAVGGGRHQVGRPPR
jgi:alkylation response protein AidB-like acyl-CoA dehydrogenase